MIKYGFVYLEKRRCRIWGAAYLAACKTLGIPASITQKAYKTPQSSPFAIPTAILIALKSCDSSLKTNRCAIVCTTSSPELDAAAMLAHKVAVITGAGRGIGLSIAKLLAKQGASIVVNDLDAGIAEQAAASVRQDGAEAISVPGSVADDGFGERLAQETSDKFGRADILVNNAGMLWDGMLHTMQDDQWQKVLDVHATAPFRIIERLHLYYETLGSRRCSPTTVQDRSDHKRLLHQWIARQSGPGELCVSQGWDIGTHENGRQGVGALSAYDVIV